MHMKSILTSDFEIEGILVGHAGDLLEAYDARPEKGEPADAVVGYCDIFNHSSGVVTETTWSEVEGMIEPSPEPIISYYECEFAQEEPDAGAESICIKGERIPSPEEATVFLEKDITDWYYAPVVKVRPITKEEAQDCFCLDNEKDWPIFK